VVLLQERDQVGIAELGHGRREMSRRGGAIRRRHGRAKDARDRIIGDGHRLDVIGRDLRDEGRIGDRFVAL